MILRPYAPTCDSENRIASISGGSDNPEADSNLFAAAPDLLAALKSLTESAVTDSDACSICLHGTPIHLSGCTVVAAQSAIAKAEGRFAAQGDTPRVEVSGEGEKR
jgi:hypothetical protein